MRAEDHYPQVRRAAADLRRKLPGRPEIEELVSIGMEAVVRAAPGYRPGPGTPDGFAYMVARRAMVDAARAVHGRNFDRATVVRMDRAALGNVARRADSAEDEACRSVFLAECLALLTPRQRRIALAAMEPGGQRRLAEELGVTEAALSHQRHAIRRRLSAYFGREAA